MARRYRRRSTTERGYGSPHQREQRQRIALWQPGDPCARCGHPMQYRWTLDRRGRKASAIHLGHTADRTGYTGLEHAYCNLRDGAIRGNRQRGLASALLASRW